MSKKLKQLNLEHLLDSLSKIKIKKTILVTDKEYQREEKLKKPKPVIRREPIRRLNKP